MVCDVPGHNPGQAAEIIRRSKPGIELRKIVEVACIEPRIAITHWIVERELGIRDNDDWKYKHDSGDDNSAQMFTWAHSLEPNLTWSRLDLLSVSQENSP